MLCAISSISKLSINVLRQNVRYLHLASTNEAARKGTREKARKKKVKVEVQKVGFIPHNQRGGKNKQLMEQTNKHIDDSWKAVSTDNAYVGRYYRWRVYSVQEAIECHRETHHPTMYNVPNAPLHAHIELNMQGEKITRFVDNFHRMALIPHKFDHGEDRTVLAFAKGQENLKAASEAGATLVGGPELVKDIQNGDLLLNDYQYVVAHPNILPDLVPLRGLMKRKFPNPKNGTLGTNLNELVQRFYNGIQYGVTKDENQQNFGLISTIIGTLSMDPNQLEENLAFLLRDIDMMRPKRQGKFICRVLLKSPPSGEKLKINPFLYVEEEKAKFIKKDLTTEDLEEDQVEEDVKQQAAVI